MTRELIVLGTASQAPTRHRNHNGYLLKFDQHGFLFDPGEGTQRQMAHAGVSSSEITRICVTHFHGDHALGLPGVLQRISLDAVPHPVTCHFPGEDGTFFARLRYATPYWERAEIVPFPIHGLADVDCGGSVTLSARPLDHRIPCYGYRIVEADGRRLLPERLAAAGIVGPMVGRLQKDGFVDTESGRVLLGAMSVERPGQVAAFIMDTKMCDGAVELAAGADMLIVESTFQHADAELAESFSHLTSLQAGRLAADAGARELVLTHFSQRYRPEETERFREEAATVFGGPIHLAEDLTRIPFPTRQVSQVR